MTFSTSISKLNDAVDVSSNGAVNFVGAVSAGGVSLGSTRISNIVVDDNTYTAIGAQAVDVSGGYVTLIGSGFQSGIVVQIAGTNAVSTQFINDKTVYVRVPAMSAGYYNVTVYNPDGTTATKVNGLQYSAMPVWVSNASYSTSKGTVSFQMNATSDSAVTYSLANGSSIPANVNLSNTGLLSGTIADSNGATYNFNVVATDAEQQTITQSFALTRLSLPIASGGTQTTSGLYTILTFNSSGTLTVNRTGTVDCLIVAGGGAGAWNGSGGGGGGAGGLLYLSSQTLSPGTYAVTVGGGGARAGSFGGAASSGSNSDVAGLGPAYGGGAGGQDNSNGYSGGSGGGASGNYHSGGSGTGGQGNRGGSTSVSSMGAGGGGAGAVGGDAASVYYSFYGYNLDTAGSGGSGLAYDISGTSTYYAGGGGGGHAPDTPGGGGGNGGGGRGGANNGAASGATNRGGGGGGSNPTYSGDVGGAGGSGIVIIRFLTAS
jgi:hypothetical protein